MSATTTLTKTSVSIKLDNGNSKTVSVSLGSLDKSAFDADKAMNIIALLANILDKQISTIEKTDKSELKSE